MVERLALLDELRSGRFDVSIITTFNIHFPFYEAVVLRRLLAAGCQHNLVLVDAAQCGAVLPHPDLRPRLAGAAYTLVPVRMPGAFHPKLTMLIGKKAAKLFVGSHNLTYAGWAHNVEVTNLIDTQADGESVALVRSALDAVRDWGSEHQDLVRGVLDAVSRSARWLRSVKVEPSKSRLLWSSSSTPSLWSQLRTLVGTGLSRVSVVGPYFDADLAFLRQLEDALNPKEVIVGVDPASVALDHAKLSGLKRTRFVDAEPIMAAARDAEGARLRAKLLLIESATGPILVAGSANPSAAAWLASKHNCEAVVVRIADAREAADDLGLATLQGALVITDSQWDAIAERHRDDGNGDARPEASAALVAVADAGRIVIEAAPDGIERVALHVDDDALEPTAWRYEGRQLLITSDPTTVRSCSLVELGCATPAFALVHQAGLLRPKGSGNVQRELRSALAGLPVDPTGLERVMGIVEKAIFEEQPIEVTTEPTVGSERSSTSSSDLPTGPLAIGLDEVRRRKKPRAVVAQGDLAVVLDLLIRRLGEGLDSPEPSDPAEDDGEAEDPAVEAARQALPDVDGQALLKACHRKVKKLLDRMTRQLQRLDGSPRQAVQAIVRLAAVLGILRWLRHIGPTLGWLPFGETLIPFDTATSFFWSASTQFGPSEANLLDAARTEVGDGGWEEASVVLGLLTWLGREAEIDLRRLKLHPDEDEREDHHWVARLLWVMRYLADDPDALLVARDAIVSRRMRGEAESWLRTHQAWAQAFALAETDPAAAPLLSRPAVRGDLVRLDLPRSQQVVFVVDLQDDTKLVVGAPGRVVLRRFATVVDWRALSS